MGLEKGIGLQDAFQNRSPKTTPHRLPVDLLRWDGQGVGTEPSMEAWGMRGSEHVWSNSPKTEVVATHLAQDLGV